MSVHLLKIGDSILFGNQAVIVEKLLGNGGQGEVYQVSFMGKPLALKWYYPHILTPTLKQNIQRLVKTGSPSKRFLWPVACTETPSGGFGYLMPIRKQNFCNIADLMAGRINPSFRAICHAAILLSHSFLQLHIKGLCYQDISFGNFFFSPENGEILICDTDNVQPEGTPTEIAGTPRFMAPEVVLGTSKPSIVTDQYSLAVLLFYLLCLHHPLEGRKEQEVRCMDMPAMRRLYGEQPVFIFDPINPTNVPVPESQGIVLQYWSLLPNNLKQLFSEAFTTGLQANARIRESVWRTAFQQATDSIFCCPTCGAERFVETDLVSDTSCWNCKQVSKPELFLHTPAGKIAISEGAQLMEWHVSQSPKYDSLQPIGVIQKNEAGQFELRNTSTIAWKLQQTTQVVPAGESVPLRLGLDVEISGVMIRFC